MLKKFKKFKKQGREKEECTRSDEQSSPFSSRVGAQSHSPEGEKGKREKSVNKHLHPSACHNILMEDGVGQNAK